jgi:hypothetical protein
MFAIVLCLQYCILAIIKEHSAKVVLDFYVLSVDAIYWLALIDIYINTFEFALKIDYFRLVRREYDVDFGLVPIL